jgi:hypothetical protein
LKQALYVAEGQTLGLIRYAASTVADRPRPLAQWIRTTLPSAMRAEIQGTASLRTSGPGTVVSAPGIGERRSAREEVRRSIALGAQVDYGGDAHPEQPSRSRW